MWRIRRRGHLRYGLGNDHMLRIDGRRHAALEYREAVLFHEVSVHKTLILHLKIQMRNAL